MSGKGIKLPIPGRTDGNAPASGMIGEQLFAQNAGITQALSQYTRNLLTLTIPTNGVYLITGRFQVLYGANPGASGVIMSTTSGTSNVFSQHGKTVAGYTDIAASPGSNVTNYFIGHIANVMAPLSAGTVLYLNCYTDVAVTITGGQAFISAIRIA